MSEPLPAFRYHPDPVSTGSVIADSDTPCLSCNRIRGYLHTGPVYTAKNFNLEHHLCPWCIADGSAARQFGATFNSTGIPELDERTPGFEAWQDSEWLTHCDEPAEFLGRTGARELKEKFPEAIPTVLDYIEESFELQGDDRDEFYRGLDKDGQPTAYVFRCLKCRTYLASVDQT